MVVSTSALYNYLLDDLRASGFDSSILTTEVQDFWPGASAADIYALRLARSLLKKLQDEVEPTADQRCLEKFHHSNKLCAGWQLNLQTSKDEELVGEFQRSIDQFFYPEGEPLVQSTMEVFLRGRPGPGASLGANGADFFTKFFSSRLSATSSEVYRQYIEGVLWYSVWRDAEFNRLISYGLPSYSPSNRLTYVRKTRSISRSICTEPSLNMFFQLGLGEIISDRLHKYFGICLSDQPEKNKRLAQRGSIDDSLVTIDLESASDSMSNAMCDRFLPEFLLELLSEYRCKSTIINREPVTLHMVSTMGNGFTFPLQTAIFACAVRAVANWHGVKLDTGTVSGSIGNWGVFGDDIICQREIAGDVIRLITILGFRVNASKSYVIGPFRESCGADFYNGVNVRGVYLKSLLTQQSRYVAINALNEWTSRSGIPLPRAVGYLVDSVRYLAVPPLAAPDAGIRSPRPAGRVWSVKHQRYCYRGYAPIPYILSVDDGERILAKTYRRKPLRRRVSNPEGLEYSFLGGYIRNTQITLPLKQGEMPEYRTRVFWTPFWGATLDQVRDAPSLEFWERRNAAAFDMNMSDVPEV